MKMILSKLIMKKLSKIDLRCLSNYSNIASIYQDKNPGDAIEIKGWIKSMRKMKNNVFFDVTDGSCEKGLQVIVAQNSKPDNLSVGCSVMASGNLNTTPKGDLELHASQVEVLGKCILSDGYPLSPKKTYPADYIRQYLHLRPRTSAFASLLRLRDTITLATHQHLHDEGYINIHTPILTSNDCEGAGEVFVVKPYNEHAIEATTSDEAFFDSKVFLTVSGQLHLEAAAHSFSKVYTFGPTFRAENSRSRLHLSEFYMLEAEVAFVDTIQEICDVVEKLVKTVASEVLNKNPSDLRYLQNKYKSDLSWIEKKFHVVTYDEAADVLDRNGDRFTVPFSRSHNFAKEHELFLVRHFDEVPVFVINWPKSTKPFYAKECEGDPANVAALDLLGPNVGEIAGGSLRENDHRKLEERLPKNKTNLEWYLELRKFGGVPTGGFGLGFERFIQFITGIDNIKDAIPFPRWPHNCAM